MKECHKKEIRIHEVDEASFQTILTSFYTGFLSVCSQCVIRILKTGKNLNLRHTYAFVVFSQAVCSSSVRIESTTFA